MKSASCSPSGFITLSAFLALHGKAYSKTANKKLKAAGDLVEVGDCRFVRQGVAWPLVRRSNNITRMREFARTARAAEYASA